MDVTVIVPLHNAEETIVRCLDSIAAQTAPPARVVVVDDASTDASAAVVERLARPNVEIVRLPRNVGPGAARNCGVKRAATEWISFLDADNEWAPEFLAEVTTALAATGAGFGGSGGVRQKVQPIQTTQTRLLPSAHEAADRSATFWRMALRFMPVVPSSAVVRRAAFEAVGGFPEDVRTGEDITLFARLWLRERFAFVNKPLYVSVQRPGSLTAGGRSYHDVRLLLARLGRVLLSAIGRRRAGTGWFIVAYARMVVGRHADWLARALSRRPGRDSLAKPENA